MYLRRILKISRGRYVAIPKKLCVDLSIFEGDYVTIEREENGLSIKLYRDEKKQLEDEKT